MKNQLKIAIVLSLVLHLGLVTLLLWWYTNSPDRAAGLEESVVIIDIHEELTSPLPLGERVRERGKVATPSPKGRGEHLTTNSSRSTSDNRQSTIDKSGNRGSSTILSQIKTKIERAKRYPKMARRMGIEGRPSIVFQINPDGSVKYVRVTISSGNDDLDNAAVEAVREATPLPYYENPIKLALRYSLR